MNKPKISVLISTYQRPAHLYRCLLSLTAQVNVEGCFEVIVTDDGSTDETFEIVRYFSNVANFNLKFTTHQHGDFQLARCRNEGIALAEAPYILMSDGDCVFPLDHIYWHLRFRKRGRVIAGDSYRLSEVQSESVDEDTILSGNLNGKVDDVELRRIRRKALRGYVYSKLSIDMRPRLTGNNIAAWRHDLESVNGFDEEFVGWGLEDRDLQRRLKLHGIRSYSILHKTAAYHLWHEPAPSFARNNSGTMNLEYYNRGGVETLCRVGLAQRIPSTRDLLNSREFERRKFTNRDRTPMLDRYVNSA